MASAHCVHACALVLVLVLRIYTCAIFDRSAMAEKEKAPPNFDLPIEVEKRLSYEFFHHLKHEYVATTTVTCVAFSPDDSYIACGADDGTISIWSNSLSGTLLHVLSGKNPILCIMWLDSDHLLGGMANGVLACIEIDKVFLRSVIVLNPISPMYS